MPADPVIDVAALRVTKRLAPMQPGAIKLARRYGDALVCVRYRRDAQGSRRYTTVELIVECTPVSTARRDREVEVEIPWNQRRLRATALSRGATWDPQRRLWNMPRHLAEAQCLQPQALHKT